MVDSFCSQVLPEGGRELPGCQRTATVLSQLSWASGSALRTKPTCGVQAPGSPWLISDSCPQLLSLGQRFPNFSEIPLPAFHLVCQLPSDLFAQMFLLDVISGLIRKRETHILSSHPLPKAAFLPKLSPALPAPSVSLLQTLSYVTNICLTFAPKSADSKCQGVCLCSKIQPFPFPQPPILPSV